MSDRIELSSLNSLSYNPRIISTEQLERLKKSIKEHTKAIPEANRGEGYRLTTTVTINKNGNRIIGGHQRIKALKSLGQDWIHKDDITWVEVEPDSVKEKSFNITLNSERLTGEWDQKKLDTILEDIKVNNNELFVNLDFGPVEVDMPDVEAQADDIPLQVVQTKSMEEEDKEEDEEEEAEEEEDSDFGEESSDDSPSEPTPARSLSAASQAHVAVAPSATSPVNESTYVLTADKKKSEPDFENNAGQASAATIINEALSGSGNTTTTTEQLFPVSYAVSGDQRNAIVNAINKCKNDHSITNSAEALVKLCEIWFAKQNAGE